MHVSPFEKYCAFEDRLAEGFRKHPLWQRLRRMQEKDFLNILLQLSCLSIEFVPWYQGALLGMEQEAGREVIRHILWDEIPRNHPTHQEDRVADLLRMNVTKELALNPPKSARTKGTIRSLSSLTKYPQARYDLKVLVILRVAGERLAGETYTRLVPEIARRFDVPVTQMRFYEPHAIHDIASGSGHADSFNTVLSGLINDELSLETAKRAARRACKARMYFYDQFID